MLFLRRLFFLSVLGLLDIYIYIYIYFFRLGVDLLVFAPRISAISLDCFADWRCFSALVATSSRDNGCLGFALDWLIDLAVTVWLALPVGAFLGFGGMGVMGIRVWELVGAVDWMRVGGVGAAGVVTGKEMLLWLAFSMDGFAALSPVRSALLRLIWLAVD
jgi:hypothetical protein